MHTFANGTKGIISVPSLVGKFGMGVLFTSRTGGVSDKTHESFNLSFNVGDERDAVMENRDRLSKDIGLGLDHWVFCRQVHGCRIQNADRYDWGRGARDYESAIPRTDAIITEERGAVIGVLTADCLPVAIVAGRRRICAVAHAGWRGVLAGVVPKTYNRVRAKSGEKHGEIEIFIGPHIRSCCFEVQEDTGRMFQSEPGGISTDKGPGRGKYIDLESVLIRQLAAVGVPDSNIHSAGICTSCNNDYFSYRREMGRTGRQAGIAVIY